MIFRLLLTLTLLFGINKIQCQTQIADLANDKKTKKFYAYWGWNRSWYTKSSITFKGDNYDFILKDVVAKDRQSAFTIKNYFSPKLFTVPQYNFRFGYQIKEKYDLSLGIDHMKYVAQNGQEVIIDGFIENTETFYNGIYDDEKIILAKDFLLYEHSDGLNYIFCSLRRSDDIFEKGIFKFSISEAFAIGAALPKTNATLLGLQKRDDFDLSGFGLDLSFGLRALLWDRIFIQTEIKTGYINMPSVRTSLSKNDSAAQDFLFIQSNLLFGVKF